MAETPPQPPGWPYNQDPNADPPVPNSPPAYEAPQYQSPPPPTPPTPPQYQSPYEPAVPSVPPAPHVQPGFAQQYGGPGQPPPPPGWSAPVGPPKKSRRTLWITLAVVFGVLALAVGSCTVWFISTVTAPVDTANEFLASIDRGNYADAIALSDPDCSQGMSQADLVATFRGADIEYNLNNSSITNSNATVSGSFSVAGENLSTVEIYLRNNDGWRVCGFNAN